MSPNISRFRSYIIAGLGACGGAVVVYYGVRQYDKKQVCKHDKYASWTTEYDTPSCYKWDCNWDRREPECVVRPSKGGADGNVSDGTLEKSKYKAVRNLFLVRHGQFKSSEKLDQDRILTELGRQQAVMSGQRLKLLGFPYSLVVSSTMTRAIETASLIAQFLPGVRVEQCAMLEEGSPIPPEPARHFRPEEFRYFVDGPRIEGAFRKHFHRADATQQNDTYEVYVCHSNVIRYIVCRALQFPADSWHRFSLNHASITWISILPSGRVRLHLGENGHMSPDNITNKNHPEGDTNKKAGGDTSKNRP